MLDFKLDLGPLASALNALPAQAQVAQEAALDAVAKRAHELKLDEVQKTYDRPEPKGRPRTGNFKSGQRIESAPGVRTVGVHGPAEAYEPILARLKTERVNPAAENAYARLEPEAPQIAERAFRESLERQRS